jgi:redox-sensitive bicupin YhaK (pirin superfamily)
MDGVMSNLEKHPAELTCGAQPAAQEMAHPVTELLEPRKVWLGKTTQVRRLLPHKERRMVGAWCFVDHYGPDDIRLQQGMRVPPHPHCSLQTVSWLFEGEVLHRDSAGSVAMVRPGELNIMTAGRGIAHSEESPGQHAPILHGAQLWVALPSGVTAEPGFGQYAALPGLSLDGVHGTVMVGEVAGVTSPAVSYSPLVGADLTVADAAEVPLTKAFEYAVLVVDGRVELHRPQPRGYRCRAQRLDDGPVRRQHGPVRRRTRLRRRPAAGAGDAAHPAPPARPDPVSPC